MRHENDSTCICTCWAGGSKEKGSRPNLHVWLPSHIWFSPLRHGTEGRCHGGRVPIGPCVGSPSDVLLEEGPCVRNRTRLDLGRWTWDPCHLGRGRLGTLCQASHTYVSRRASLPPPTSCTASSFRRFRWLEHAVWRSVRSFTRRWVSARGRLLRTCVAWSSRSWMPFRVGSKHGRIFLHLDYRES